MTPQGRFSEWMKLITFSNADAVDQKPWAVFPFFMAKKWMQLLINCSFYLFQGVSLPAAVVAFLNLSPSFVRISYRSRICQEGNNAVCALCGNRAVKCLQWTGASDDIISLLWRHFCWTAQHLFLDLKTADSKCSLARRCSQSVLVQSFCFFREGRSS